MSALCEQAHRLKIWLSQCALPFWQKHGRDEQGGFYEHLLLDRAPDRRAIRRHRIQARQVYVYATAQKLGWYDAQNIATECFDFMCRQGHQRGDQPGFIHRLNSDYSVNDARRDLYDHAFYLLACASIVNMGLSPHHPAHQKALAIGDDIMHFIDTYLASDMGGWLEEFPTMRNYRRQNPHMHLLESFLAWFDATGNTIWMERATLIIKLFEEHFFDPKHHIIREYFHLDWSVYKDKDRSKTQPGHAAEWIWLLWEYEKHQPRNSANSIPKMAQALYDKIMLGRSVFLNDEETIKADICRDSKRLWVQTELIKAHLAQYEQGSPGSDDMAAAAIEGLFKCYLNPDGTWNDQINSHGQNIAQTIPVSTFYHILGLGMEADRLSSHLAQPQSL